jgi:hypothetical protein
MFFEAPFNDSLFVEIRKRMGEENIEKINNLIYIHLLLQTKKLSGSDQKKGMTIVMLEKNRLTSQHKRKKQK